MWLIQLKISKHGEKCGWFFARKPKEEKYGWRFLRLKANSKGTSDLFTGSKALKKVLLINLAGKMPEEQNI